ncbi:LysR family transcriptional regulator [Thalassomonas sp. M1454]|uniref:LysR family transcriptional regulator n=1 Tax=Thalassomonas sp. M1454 TaxID=2594477 RepID=UPI00117E78D3|nr:LysR family transcriptional regulator [Thalassomonas sp. M1454]TRX54002.1 LysR family transcriptional regulator [Thalassomonas sp. M1454]
MNWESLKIFLEVAKTQRLSTAARALGIDSSTVSRRIHQLEESLEVRLFERSVEGHYLTEQGELLFTSALAMEQSLQSSVASLQGLDLEESGNVRIGTTEAFGSFFVTPNLFKFNHLHPKISVDVLPLLRKVKLYKHEADIAISIGKPRNTSMVVAKLCDYRLKVYASKKYLANNPVAAINDLNKHNWISYVEHLDFSDQLEFLNDIAPGVTPVLRSTSVVAQYMAVKNDLGLAVLPCFLASQDSELEVVLDNKIDIIREFWLMTQPDSKRVKRVQILWDYLKQLVQDKQAVLLDHNIAENK